MFQRENNLKRASSLVHQPVPARPRLEPLEDRLLLATYTVSHTGDSGVGSLRQSIINSNANAGKDTIVFNIPGTGAHFIAPLASLPTITDLVIIDGFTQPGASPNTAAVGNNAVWKILLIGNNALGSALTITAGNSEVRGLRIYGFSSASALRLVTNGGNTVDGNYLGDTSTGNANGVRIESANNTIGGGAPEERNIISGSNGYGIHLTGSGATGNKVQGNYIGTSSTGGTKQPNALSGVFLDNNAHDNTIGGGEFLGIDSVGNVISGNGGSGIYLFGTGVTGNKIYSNYIGTTATGTAALSNTESGVRIRDGDNNRVGTPPTVNGGFYTFYSNVIAGNGIHGIFVQNASGTLIQDNYIGTNGAGTAAISNGASGVAISNGVSTIVGGTASGAGNLISGNGDDGILLDGQQNAVEGNYVGTNAAGTAALPNGSDGVAIVGGSANSVGDGTAEGRNVISGNGASGVYITGTATTGNQIEGNHIGTNAAGTAALGNVLDGVILYNGTHDNTVGGGEIFGIDSAGNVISGNKRYGVHVYGSHSNDVYSNYIGTNAAGTAAVANILGGVAIVFGDNNQVGKPPVTIDIFVFYYGNVISGNASAAVRVDEANATLIQANHIGTSGDGTAGVANLRGVSLGAQAIGTTIGGTSSGARNVISGNNRDGIEILGASGTLVQGNYIGTKTDGVGSLGNGQWGIVLNNSATNNAVGGTAAAANRIAFNGDGGVDVLSGTGNPVLGNSIHSNGGLGIDLNGDGVTLNDPPPDADSGPQNLQNFPLLNSVSGGGGAVTVQATLVSVPNATYRVEFFGSDSCDPSGYGEGQSYLGSKLVTTNPAGRVRFASVLTTSAAYITATATDAANNTSEFSTCTAVSSNLPTTDGGGLSAMAMHLAFEPIFLEVTDTTPEQSSLAERASSYPVDEDAPAQLGVESSSLKREVLQTRSNSARIGLASTQRFGAEILDDFSF